MASGNGFIIRHEGMENIPALACEKCGQIITDYKMAGVAWGKDTDRDGGRSRAIVLCKENHCLATPPYADLPWMEMRDYMLFMARNSGLKTEAQLREALEASDIMERV